MAPFSRSFKIKQSARLLLCVLLSCTLVFSKIACGESTPDDLKKTYQNVFSTAQSVIDTEKKLFSRLVFSSAHETDQITLGKTTKFVLSDQLNRKWVYKVFSSHEDYNTLICYQLACLFGIKMPETHIKDLIINNTAVRGLMVLYIDDIIHFRNLDHFKTTALSPHATRDMARKEVLDFLVENLDVHLNNLLFKYDSTSVTDVYGIDMHYLFPTLDGIIDVPIDDLFSYTKQSNLHTGQSSVYATFWEREDIKKDPFLLVEMAPYIHFITSYPQNFIYEIIHPHWGEQIQKKFFKRQRSIGAVFTEYYAHLDPHFVSRPKSSIHPIFDSLQNAYVKKTAQLLDTSQLLAKISQEKQEKIDFVASWRAWDLINAFQSGWYQGTSTDLLSELEKMQNTTENLYERHAIQHYCEQIKTKDIKKITQYIQTSPTLSEIP